MKLSKLSMQLDFSELFMELGDFGYFQKYMLLLGCLIIFMPGMAVVSNIFVSKSVNHRYVTIIYLYSNDCMPYIVILHAI